MLSQCARLPAIADIRHSNPGLRLRPEVAWQVMRGGQHSVKPDPNDTYDSRATRMDLKDHIRGIPDFPKPGILFYDISTLLRDADAWQVAMGRMARAVRPHLPDLVAGIESRGFLVRDRPPPSG